MAEQLTDEQKKFISELEPQARGLNLADFYTRIKELSNQPIKDFLKSDLSEYPDTREALSELSKIHVLIVNYQYPYNKCISL